MIYHQQMITINDKVPTSQAMAASLMGASPMGAGEFDDCIGLTESSLELSPSLVLRLRVTEVKRGGVGQVNSFSLGLMVISRYLRTGLA